LQDIPVEAARKICTAACGELDVPDYDAVGYSELGTHPFRSWARWKEREIRRRFPDQGRGFLAPYEVQIPLLELKRGMEDEADDKREIQASLYALLPWHFMEAAALAPGDCFEQSFLDFGSSGSASSPSEYWDMSAEEEWGREHPVWSLADRRHCLPCYWHIDDMWSWGSSLTSGSSLRTRFYVLSYPSFRRSPNTNLEIVKFVRWLHEVMASGITPTTGYCGEHLEGGGRPFGFRDGHCWTMHWAGMKCDMKALGSTEACRLFAFNLVSAHCAVTSFLELLAAGPSGLALYVFFC